MKYLFYILIALVLIIGIYAGFLRRKEAERSTQAPQVPNPSQNWETRRDDQPPVSIKVTPVEFGKNASRWKFEIALDTHAGSLDQDMLRVSVLSDDKGKMYKPIVWEGPGPGGHHREGILVFDVIRPTPAYAELKIKEIGGIPERSFRWNLE